MLRPSRQRADEADAEGLLHVLDLFSGIGGFSLGLERTGGFQTVAFCESDPFCRQVLARHWPGVPIFQDVRELDGEQFRGAIDLVCGGFPCQDISFAGRQAGIDADRSGLWSDLARIISEVAPRYAVVENVPALLSGDRGRWFSRVLGDLAAVGYDAEWHCIPAFHVGAPHRRDRVWVIAYPQRHELRVKSEPERRSSGAPLPRDDGAERVMAYPNSGRLKKRPKCDSEQREGKHRQSRHDPFGCGVDDWWKAEPDVGRVADGVPYRVDRLRALGNAVVPQVVELIGRSILRHGRSGSLRDETGKNSNKTTKAAKGCHPH